MIFPSRDLTTQQILNSYQNVVQKYDVVNTASYFLDGLGNVITYLLPTSVGQQLLTVDQTGSIVIQSSSYSISSSWAPQSVFPTSVDSSSWASSSVSSSYISPYSLYSTISTSSVNWITASFSSPNQYVNITNGNVYNFTSSDMPSIGYTAKVSLFINNTAITTSSLSFPSSWVWLNIIPVSMSISKSALLNLQSFGNQIVADWRQHY